MCAAKIMRKTCMQRKIKKVMHEFKHHKLHSGRKGKLVKKRKQAIAIGMSQARHKCK
jgi:hypothetical protein